MERKVEKNTKKKTPKRKKKKTAQKRGNFFLWLFVGIIKGAADNE